MENFSDFIPLTEFLFNEHPEITLENLIGKLDPGQAAKLLKICEWELEKVKNWHRDEIFCLFQDLAKTEEKKLKEILCNPSAYGVNPEVSIVRVTASVSIPASYW